MCVFVCVCVCVHVCVRVRVRVCSLTAKPPYLKDSLVANADFFLPFFKEVRTDDCPFRTIYNLPNDNKNELYECLLMEL